MNFSSSEFSWSLTMLIFKLASTCLRFKLYVTPSFELHSASPRTSLHVQLRFTLPWGLVSLTNISLPASLLFALQFTLRFIPSVTCLSISSQILLHFSVAITSLHTTASLTRPSHVPRAPLSHPHAPLTFPSRSPHAPLTRPLTRPSRVTRTSLTSDIEHHFAPIVASRKT